MKTTKFLAIAIIAVASVTSQVVAQETKIAPPKGKQTQSATFGDRVNAGLQQAGSAVSGAAGFTIQVIPTETGCDIASWSWGASNSSNSSGGVMAVGKMSSNRDAASGLATGRRQVSVPCCDHETTQTYKNCAAGKHFKDAKLSMKNSDSEEEDVSNDKSKIKLKEVFISNHEVSNSNDEESTAVTSKAATGKHFKDATLSMKSSGGGSGAGKVSMQDFHFTVKCKGRTIPVTVDNDTCTFPEDLPDGTYDVVCSWSWGAHQTGTFTQKTINCHLKIENGVCVDMAINEKR